MTTANPIRQTLNNLAEEFKFLNINCLHFNVEMNALIEERTNMENHKLRRRICQCLRCVDFLKPETSTYYKDKSAIVMGMIQQVSESYDDLKRRYFWALDKLAEMTIKLKQFTDDQFMKEALTRQLGESWRDFKKSKMDQFKPSLQSETGDPQEFPDTVNEEYDNPPQQTETDKKSSPFEKKGFENVDRLLGLMYLGNESKISKAKDKRRKSSGKMYTKVTRSPKLTTIEDFPQVDKNEWGDYTKNMGISKIIQKLRKLKKQELSKMEESQELALASEIKLQIYALMAEVAERDELIDSLTTQMKIKDAQITQLLNIIHKEKLSIESKFFHTK